MRVLTFLVAVLVAGEVCAATLDGRVVGVHDGDTITVLDANRVQHKIRLAGIDAPEIKQAFGSRSKQNLSGLVFAHVVRVEWKKQDRFSRILGKVWTTSQDSPCQESGCPKTLDANLAQITVGMAWHYKYYERDQSPEDRQRYAFVEREARAKKVGLWADPSPVPPWEWRRKR